MAHQIQIVRSTGTKTAKNPITGKAHEFETAEDAQIFANSMAQNWNADYRNQGRRAPKFLVVNTNRA